MKLFEVLQQAKSLIEPSYRWCQMHYRQGGTQCALDAILSCRNDTVSYSMAMRAVDCVERAVKRNIVVWNDDPKTTHAMVMQAFDKAIELAKHEATSIQS